MTFVNFAFVFLVFLVTYAHGQTRSPCPFNEEACTCISSPPNVFFDIVSCESETLPVLKAPSGNSTKYVATSLQITSQEVYKIPAQYFAAFSSIDGLSLYQSGSAAVQQHWDDHAFDGVVIKMIYTDRLDGLIPAPPSLLLLGAQGLTSLSVSRGGTPIQLADSSFAAFPALNSLSIDRTTISEISDNAFSGLEKVLAELVLGGANLAQFPVVPLSKLNLLTSLDLYNNAITKIPDNALSSFAYLRSLTLDGNPLAADIEAGSLDALPRTVTILSLSNVGFIGIPTRVVDKNPNVNELFLRTNLIQTVKQGDFASHNSLAAIALDNNPISNVDVGAFQSSASTVNFILTLPNTSLTSVDLAVFTGIEGHLFSAMSNSPLLKRLTVSSLEKYPSSATIQIWSTGLETIDSKVNDLLVRYPAVILDISDSVHLHCKDLDWMAPFVLCTIPSPLEISGCTCADLNNQPLLEYLKSVQNVPCGTTVAPSSPSTNLPPTPTTDTGVVQAANGALLIASLGVGLTAFKRNY